jgi:hypothetical protein
MSNKQTSISISEDLATKIDVLVGKTRRAAFINDAAWGELKRWQLRKALQDAAGSWKNIDHPELKAGSSRFVRKLRTASDRRLNVKANR